MLFFYIQTINSIRSLFFLTIQIMTRQILIIANIWKYNALDNVDNIENQNNIINNVDNILLFVYDSSRQKRNDWVDGLNTYIKALYCIQVVTYKKYIYNKILHWERVRATILCFLNVTLNHPQSGSTVIIVMARQKPPTWLNHDVSYLTFL